MYNILIISTKQNNSIDSILPQIQYLKNYNIHVDLAIDLTEWELTKCIVQKKFDCAYVHVKRRFSHIEEKGNAYDPVKLLEHHNIPVIGNNYILQLMIADKFWTSKHSGIGLPNLVINRDEYNNNCIDYSIIEKSIGYPIIVKPNALHASEGISIDSVVYNLDSLKKAISNAFISLGNIYEILIEQYAENSIEYTVSVLGNAQALICSVSRLDFNPDKKIKINCESEKLLPLNERSFHFSVEDNQEIRNQIEYHAKVLFKHFKLKDFARFDFVYKNQSFYLLEANTCPIPGNSFSWEWQQLYGLKTEQIIALYLVSFHYGQISNYRSDALPNMLINSLPQEIIGKIKKQGIFDTVPECADLTLNYKYPYLYSMNDRISSESDVHTFLKALTILLKPQLILETGTYKGNSTIAFAEGIIENGCGKVISIEINKKLALNAREKLIEYPVEIINGNSLKYIPFRNIDLLFLDSARGIRKMEFMHFKQWLHEESIIVWHDSSYRKKNHLFYNDLIELHNNNLITYLTLSTPRGLIISKMKKLHVNL